MLEKKVEQDIFLKKGYQKDPTSQEVWFPQLIAWLQKYPEKVIENFNYALEKFKIKESDFSDNSFLEKIVFLYTYQISQCDVRHPRLFEEVVQLSEKNWQLIEILLNRGFDFEKISFIANPHAPEQKVSFAEYFDLHFKKTNTSPNSAAFLIRDSIFNKNWQTFQRKKLNQSISEKIVTTPKLKKHI